MHTNLDSAPSAASMLLMPVGLEFVETLQKAERALLGQIARPVSPLTLGELARNYRRAFGRVAKVWGDPARELKRVAVCSGGAGEVIRDVLAAGVDCFVTGELRHHEEVYLADEGIALIELGHDISELPYRFELEKTLVAGGFYPEDIVILEPSATWWQVHDDVDRQSYDT
jgi:putative NIF3 family GTP cyclohydrolase 1 type 2